MATAFLATVIGWYLVVFGLLTLCRYEQLRGVVNDVLGHRGLLFIIAIITFILGLLMVVSHNIWIMGWPVIITVFAWLVLISGIMRLFFPDTVTRVGLSLSNNSTYMYISAVVLLLIGLYLLSHVYYFVF